MDGHTPNYVDPQTRVKLTQGWLTASMTLMLCFLCARFYARFALKTSFGVDDWIMGAAALCAVPISIIGVAATTFGLGFHLWDIKPGWQDTYAKVCIGNIALIPLSMSLTKISLCLTYLHLFPSQSNKIFCWTAIVYVACWAVASIFALIFACKPVAAVWDLSITEKKCINFRSALLSTAALNSLSDFLVFLWPTRFLWQVQIPVKQRLSLTIVFGVGCIVCVAGICRMWYFLVYLNSTDPYWEASILWCLSSTEVDVGIICGCLPGTKPLLRRLFPCFFHTSQHSASARTARTHHSQSFPFQSISGRGGKVSRVESAMNRREDGKGHFAWATGPSAELEDDEGRLVVPKDGIQVSEEVNVDSGPRLGSKDADAGSEEWIVSDSKSSLP